MPRRKGLSPDHTSHVEIRLKGNPNGSSRLQFTSSSAFLILNGTKVPSLRDGWVQSVAKHFANGLSNSDLQYVEVVIANYVNERVIRTKPITWKELLSGIDATSAAAKTLFAELNKRSSINDPIWLRVLRQIPEERRDDFTLNKVRSIVSVLTTAANAALSEAKSEKAEGKERTYKGPWIDLVNGLADIFELKVGTPSAPKNLRDGSPAKPSAFVNLVWTVMTTAVPDGLGEHATASINAMSNAVSHVLKRRGTDKKSSTGPFREFLDLIKPVKESQG
jgi:hypothetical protein